MSSIIRICNYLPFVNGSLTIVIVWLTEGSSVYLSKLAHGFFERRNRILPGKGLVTSVIPILYKQVSIAHIVEKRHFMIRDYIIQYAPMVMVILIGLFAIVKLSVISIYGLREDPMKLYVDSHKIYSRQVIKNTFRKSLKEYYAFSNRLNMLFYLILFFILFMYVLLRL